MNSRLFLMQKLHNNNCLGGYVMYKLIEKIRRSWEDESRDYVVVRFIADEDLTARGKRKLADALERCTGREIAGNMKLDVPIGSISITYDEPFRKETVIEKWEWVNG